MFARNDANFDLRTMQEYSECLKALLDNQQSEALAKDIEILVQKQRALSVENANEKLKMQTKVPVSL